MKKSAYLLILATAFAGGFAALQADKWMAKKAEPMLSAFNEPSVVQPIQYSSNLTSPPDFRQAAKKVMPSVVAIDRFERVSDMFGYDRGVQETGQGSGVILSANGTIVTNNHVVQGASEVKVRLNDKRTFTAKVLGRDPRSDLAVIKIDAPNLRPIEVGDSAQLEIGQWVMAIGNPLGFDNTVSVGVVSSLKRDLPVGVTGLVNAIQTDAAINPGNSGGALTDATGRLIGINSAIASGTGQSVGIGFAIPMDRVKQVTNDIVKYGQAKYAGLGVEYYPTEVLTYPRYRQQIADQVGASNLPESGIVVRKVSGGAQAAGIKELDILTEVDGTPIEGSFTLNKVLTPKKPGDKVQVKYWSAGKIKTTSVTLQEIMGV
ncbi:MAG: trypsin-like peptidase domain-containing protein [Fimbriimonadaceae bacterium]|nr:trypsin-like peptidase domain-containing protein [Fimbriimonadaceae bacterium]